MTLRFNKNHGSGKFRGRTPAAHETWRRESYDGDRVAVIAREKTVRIARAAVVTLCAGVTVAGCGLGSLTSSIGGPFGGGNASKGESKPLTQEGMLTAAKADGPAQVGGDVTGGCPRFQVWPRDHHVTIYETGKAGDGLAVVHRGEITQTARECSVEGNRVTVKYGFSGRVLLGPKGKSGTVTLPVNVFVADAKRERIVNDKMSIEVVVSVDKPIGYFSAVRTVTFPVGEGSRSGEYEVYVGFDQKAPGAG